MKHDYTLVKVYHDEYRFVREVDEFLLHGYTLVGGVSVVCTPQGDMIYTQALDKEVEE